MTAIKEPHLSIMDQNTYRKYIRNLFMFPFPDLCHANEALFAFRHYPHLAGTVIVPYEYDSNGHLEATYSDPVTPYHVDCMLTASFAQATNPAFDYRTMEKEGFPPAMLPSYLLCPLGLQNYPGIEHPYAEYGSTATMGHAIPIVSAQATFVSHGLILSVYLFHGAVDGGAADLFFKVWSGYVKDINDGTTLPPVDSIQSVDYSARRRALDALLPGSSSESIVKDTEWFVQPRKPPYPAVHTEPYETTGNIVCFTASTISTLKAELQALTMTRISTFTTLTTLLWTTATRVRGDTLIKAGYDTVALSIAVHFGKRAGPDSRLPCGVIRQPRTIPHDPLSISRHSQYPSSRRKCQSGASPPRRPGTLIRARRAFA